MLPDPLLDQLDLLPLDPRDPRRLPKELAGYFSQVQRLARSPRLPLAMVEYRLLAGLAISGWSLRYALVELEAEAQETHVQSGTFNRAVRYLTAAKLWETTNVRLAGHRNTLVRLTEQGRQILGEIGLHATESEWGRIERLHRGNTLRQRTHTGAICAFAYHARSHGYDTEVCPAVPGPGEPDLVLCDQQGNLLYVEVQGRGGEPWQRALKWQHLYRLQGEAAICALTPAQARRYAAEAQHAGIRQGRITDLYTLRYSQLSPLWTHRWQSRSGSLIPCD